jgi:hypothetical protein
MIGGPDRKCAKLGMAIMSFQGRHYESTCPDRAPVIDVVASSRASYASSAAKFPASDPASFVSTSPSPSSMPSSAEPRPSFAAVVRVPPRPPTPPMAGVPPRPPPPASAT